MQIKRAAAYYILIQGAIGITGILALLAFTNLNIALGIVIGGGFIMSVYLYWKYWKMHPTPPIFDVTSQTVLIE